jgi:hypothetical protein
MLGIERIAELFDELHAENKRSLGIEFQGWVNNVYRSEGETWRFYGAAATASAAEALYTFAGGVSAGFVDLLRLGDGVKAGTLGGVVQDIYSAGVRGFPENVCEGYRRKREQRRRGHECRAHG